MVNQKDFDYFIQALEITEILVSLFAISQPLGIAVGVVILTYLYLMSKDDENREEK